MANNTQYKEQILKELQALPEEALPKVLRLITLLRQEFLTHETREPTQKIAEETSHEKTRRLLASSKSNWAQELIAEREDRL